MCLQVVWYSCRLRCGQESEILPALRRQHADKGSIVNRRRTITLFLIIFSNFLGATVVLPTLPLYAQREFAMSPDAIATLLDSYFIAQFIASPYIGKLSD